MKLVLVEKPSAARNFAKALGGMSGTYEGEDYQISALRGHVLELVTPENQVEESKREHYGKWTLDNLPWNIADIKFVKQVAPECEDLLDKLKASLTEAEEVIIATDDDPSGEGELLAWEALEWCGWQGQTSRMYFTDEASRSIQKAFDTRSPIASMEEDGDYVKASVREKWDFCSMQFTRAASCVAKEHGFRTVVRQGRLKSVMVRLVGNQLIAYNSHVRRPFFEVRYKDDNGNMFVRKGDIEINRFDSADKVSLSELHASGIVVDSCERKRTAPGKLLDLAGISAILAKLGHKPEAVLATYQKMYEAQVVSYPRTEDKMITPEQFEELLPLADDIARVVGIDPSMLTCRSARKTHIEEGGAHGANRPGINVPGSLDELSSFGPEAEAIYTLLAKNFLAMLAPDFEYELVRGHVLDFPDFIGETKVPVAMGFKAIFDTEASSLEGAEDQEAAGASRFGEQALPYVHEGANKRPQRPTMKWLNKRLEKHRVGTGATRTSTLAEITAENDRALMGESKGNLSLTRCGAVSFTLLDGCQIASPEATEQLFSAMECVGKFEADPSCVLATVTDMVMHDCKQMIQNAPKLADLGLKATSSVLCACPRCGQDVIAHTKVASCLSNKTEKHPDGTYTQTQGCGFKVFRCVAGKPLSDTQLAHLIETGHTSVIKGFKSKAGKSFDAALKLNADGNIEFVFSEKSTRKGKPTSARRF